MTTKTESSSPISVKNLQKRGKLIIPLDVLDKIKYTCNQISLVEWSGILFYNFEGNLTEPETLVYTLKDLFLMDKGTGAHTDFKYNEDILDILQHKEELEDCLMAMCHSHNSMAVFFSGEDTDELKINVPNYNQYLSVIVNNKTEICAKVAFMAKKEAKTTFLSKFKDSLGVDRFISSESVAEELIMYTIDMDVMLPEITDTIEPFFKERVAKVIAIADKPKHTTYAKSYTQKDFMSREDNFYQGNHYESYNRPEMSHKEYWEQFSAEKDAESAKGKKGLPALRPTASTTSKSLDAKKDTIKVTDSNGVKVDERDYLLFLNHLLSGGICYNKTKVELNAQMGIMDSQLLLNPSLDLKNLLEEEYLPTLLFVLGDSTTLEEMGEFIRLVNFFIVDEYASKFTDSKFQYKLTNALRTLNAEMIKLMGRRA